MICVLNIGNTHTEVGWRENGIWKELQFFETSTFPVESLPTDAVILAASVVPHETERLKKQRPDIRFLAATEPLLPVDFSQVDCSTTGADRVANAVALATGFPLPGLVLDCGTAITVEVVDKNRIFRGGAIAPGRRLMRRILHAGTAQLPEIPLQEKMPGKIGMNTADSIAFGVDAGCIGLVRTLVSRAALEYGCVSLLGTGGDIDFFLPEIAGLQRAEQTFTLQGILAAFPTNAEETGFPR